MTMQARKGLSAILWLVPAALVVMLWTTSASAAGPCKINERKPRPDCLSFSTKTGKWRKGFWGETDWGSRDWTVSNSCGRTMRFHIDVKSRPDKSFTIADGDTMSGEMKGRFTKYKWYRNVECCHDRKHTCYGPY